jgi:hypothetical protein
MNFCAGHGALRVAASGQVAADTFLAVLPNWTGTERRRYCEFQDGRLILKTSPKLSGGKEGMTVPVWRRKEPVSRSKTGR